MTLTKEYVLEVIELGVKKFGSISEFERNVGFAKQRIKDIKRAKGIPPAADWEKIKAAVFNDNQDRIPILGSVGAGAKVFPIDDFELGAASEYTDLPIGLEYSDALYALRVEGDSQAPMFFDGYMVYAKTRMEGGCSNLTSKTPHIVKIKNGATMLKLVRRGYTPGKFNLLSYNADDIIDVDLEWCAKIEAIVPK